MAGTPAPAVEKKPISKRHVQKHDIAARLHCAAQTLSDESFYGPDTSDDAPPAEVLIGVHDTLVDCCKSIKLMLPNDPPSNQNGLPVATDAVTPALVGPAGAVLNSLDAIMSKHGVSEVQRTAILKESKTHSEATTNIHKGIYMCVKAAMDKCGGMIKEAGHDPTVLPDLDVPAEPGYIPETDRGDEATDPEHPEQEKSYRLVD